MHNDASLAGAIRELPSCFLGRSTGLGKKIILSVLSGDISRGVWGILNDYTSFSCCTSGLYFLLGWTMSAEPRSCTLRFCPCILCTF